VYYLPPTSYVGRARSGALGDATIDDATDRGATRIQASAFRGCCSIHAPRYRQANLTAFTHPSEDGARAIALAGDDVVAAFRHYLEHDARGRPFIIAGHSQGSVLAMRVLTDVVVREGLQERLIAAYLIGSSLTEATLDAIPGLAACETATQTGCIIGWNARSADYSHGLDLVEFPPPPPGAAPPTRLCVNPLTWRHDDQPGDPALHRGAVFFAGDAPPSPLPRFTGARCRQGHLIVELASPVPRDFMSKLLDHALGAGNYHPIEFGLFFVDMRDNAAERVDAYLAQSPPD